MIPKGLFSQIGMIIVAVALIVTYVQPAFAKIGLVQDNIEVYREERKKVISVNSQLATLVSRLDSISNEDKRELLTYMPDSVDVIAVPRDLAIISNEAGVLYKNATFLGLVDDSRELAEEPGVTPALKYEFTLSVEGTYGQIKNLFKLMEQNNYPLEVQSFNIKQIFGGFLAADIKIATYGYREPVTSNTIDF
jgi:hypothetical protein